jgi:hypothetical protein
MALHCNGITHLLPTTCGRGPVQMIHTVDGCHISEPTHQRRARCFAAIFTVHIAPVNVEAHFVRGRALEVGAQTQPNAVELAGGGRWAAW